MNKLHILLSYMYICVMCSQTFLAGGGCCQDSVHELLYLLFYFTCVLGKGGVGDIGGSLGTRPFWLLFCGCFIFRQRPLPLFLQLSPSLTSLLTCSVHCHHLVFWGEERSGGTSEGSHILLLSRPFSWLPRGLLFCPFGRAPCPFYWADVYPMFPFVYICESVRYATPV